MKLSLLVSLGFSHDNGGCRKSAQGYGIDWGSKLQSLQMCSQGLKLVIALRKPKVNVGIMLLLEMVVDGGHLQCSGVYSSWGKENFIVVELISRDVIEEYFGDWFIVDQGPPSGICEVS